MLSTQIVLCTKVILQMDVMHGLTGQRGHSVQWQELQRVCGGAKLWVRGTDRPALCSFDCPRDI